LLNNLREEAFNHNIAVSRYCDDSNRYKAKSVLNELKKIYGLKCAFCEKKLLDAPKHIEHYRPKKIYYWLAYSWDNLLLACGSCNSSKSDNFEIYGVQAVYQNQSFLNVNNLSAVYNTQEQPLIINPEVDDILNDLEYDKYGKLFSNNPRVSHTINVACKLNRDELLQLRQEIINDFTMRINDYYLALRKKECELSIFVRELDYFFKINDRKQKFYSLKYFIYNNIDKFFDKRDLVFILQKIIEKLK
jgi:uncharacterized protein (TIGR02646 family)